MSLPNLVPHLIVHDGLAALDFYPKALGATLNGAMKSPDDQKVVHAAFALPGGGLFYLCDDFHEAGSPRSPKALGGSSLTLNLHVLDPDAAQAQAIAAGATESMPVQDTFWGARYGKVFDPFGHEWAFHRQEREVSPEEAKAASDAFFA